MKLHLKNNLFPFMAFIAGFSLMVVELIASRILAPLVGSSIYTWTSVIGIIMIGMVAGNFTGGYLIDKYASKGTLFLLFVSAAISTLFIPTLALFAKKIVLLNYSLPVLILLITSFLFLVPSFFFGAIYPGIFKFYVQSTDFVGKKSGKLSAMWSLGSIIGTFLTGFFFIGYLGSSHTLYIISLTLLVSAFFLYIPRIQFFFILCVAIFAICSNFATKNPNNPEIIYEKESNYYNIRVVDKEISPGNPIRIMFLDFDMHSMEILSGKSLNVYTDIATVFPTINNDARKILAIGGGSESISKNMSEIYPFSDITTVEIDPEVTMVGRKFFKPMGDSNTTVISDGRFFLQKNKGKYDIIFADTFNSIASLPWHLSTKEFDALVNEHLTDGGIYAVNIISARSGENSLFFQSMLATFRQTFPNYYVFSYGKTPDSDQNMVLVGVKSTSHMDPAEFKKRLLRVKNGNFFSQALVADPEKLLVAKNTPILSDEFAPTEKLMSPLIKNYFPKFAAFHYSIL